MKTEFELPAGTYSIGDPCYLLGPWWQEVGKQTDWFSDMTEPVRMTLKSEDEGTELEVLIWAGGTAYGDGVYGDNRGNSYPVDAGIIGIVSWPYGTTFDKPFTVRYEDGVFDFGGIVIDTRGDDE